MEQQIFADGIGRIAIIDGIVRLDLVTHSATETSADGKPRLVLSSRVVMGADQFLRATEKIVEAARAIVEQRHGKAAQPAPAPAAAPVQANRPQSVDPQFKRESVRPEPVTPPTPPKPPFP
jgi:hypothetical protein